MTESSSLITTRFNATSTSNEIIYGLDLSSFRVIVTGASSGIGLETARALALANADVSLAVRNMEAGSVAAERISASTGNKRVQALSLDLANRASIIRFVQNWNGSLHLLINNAGVLPNTLLRTDEGWEMQFTTNYLGHFALSLGLHDALLSGAEELGEARIVSLTSGGHLRSSVIFEDIQFEHREYDPQSAYAQSKTADALFAVAATNHWQRDGIFTNAVNPGGVATGLQRDFTPAHKDYLAKAEASGVFTWKTVEQGAATTLVAAVSPEFANTGGHYLSDCNEAPTVPDDTDPLSNGNAVKKWANDPDIAEKLWDVSLRLLDS